MPSRGQPPTIIMHTMRSTLKPSTTRSSMPWSSWRASWSTSRSQDCTWFTTWARIRPSCEPDVAEPPALRYRLRLQTPTTSSLGLANGGGCGPTSFDASTTSIPCDACGAAPPCGSSLSSRIQKSSARSLTTSRVTTQPSADLLPHRSGRSLPPSALDTDLVSGLVATCRLSRRQTALHSHSTPSTQHPYSTNRSTPPSPRLDSPHSALSSCKVASPEPPAPLILTSPAAVPSKGIASYEGHCCQGGSLVDLTWCPHSRWY